MSKTTQAVRLSLVLGASLALGGIASDGLASGGTVTVWFDDVTNSVGAVTFCSSVTNDQNGGGNGNAGASSVTNDANSDGNGNNGQGARQICLFGVGGSQGKSK